MVSCAKAVTLNSITLTFTNTTQNTNKITINGSTATFTSAPLNSVSWIATGSSNVSATNFFRFLGANYPALASSLSSSNHVTFRGSALTASLVNDNFGYLTTNSLTQTNAYAVVIPFDTQYQSNRQNTANELIYGLDNYTTTQSFRQTSQALTNFVSLTNVQTIANKLGTNITLQGGSISNAVLTNIARANIGYATITNATIASGTATGLYIYAASSIAGTLTALTNGTLVNPFITNAPSIQATNLNAYGGTLSNFIAHTLTVTNLAAPGSGVNSSKIGASSVSSGTYSVAIGDSATASADGAVAFGQNTLASAEYSSAVGQVASATAYGSTSVGNSANTSAWGASALGAGATSAYSNSTAIGVSSATTTTNQIVLGTSAEKITIPGRIDSVVSTNETLKGVTTASTRLDFTPRSNTGLANGFNSGVVLGSNVWVKLSGHSAAITNVGFSAEGSGSYHIVQIDNPGLSVAIRHDSGLDATAANRIYTGTGGEIFSTNNPAMLQLIYDDAINRWRVIGFR